MGRPSKPMAKNSNSKFTTRNNKQDIFFKLSKSLKPKPESDKQAAVDNKSGVNNPES